MRIVIATRIMQYIEHTRWKRIAQKKRKRVTHPRNQPKFNPNPTLELAFPPALPPTIAVAPSTPPPPSSLPPPLELPIAYVRALPFPVDVPALISSLNLRCFLASIKNNPVPTKPGLCSGDGENGIVRHSGRNALTEGGGLAGWNRSSGKEDSYEPSQRMMRSSCGLALMVRMATFHTDGSSVVKVWRLGAWAKAVLSCVLGPRGLCGGGVGGGGG
jgi:hypothetical protein